jgi:hypothetical protein
MKSRFEAGFQVPVAGILPLTFDVAENASRDLFSLRHPDHEWSRALRAVAETVLSID